MIQFHILLENILSFTRIFYFGIVAVIIQRFRYIDQINLLKRNKKKNWLIIVISILISFNILLEITVKSMHVPYSQMVMNEVYNLDSNDKLNPYIDITETSLSKNEFIELSVTLRVPLETLNIENNDTVAFYYDFYLDLNADGTKKGDAYIELRVIKNKRTNQMTFDFNDLVVNATLINDYGLEGKFLSIEYILDNDTITLLIDHNRYEELDFDYTIPVKIRSRHEVNGVYDIDYNTDKIEYKHFWTK